MYLDVSDVSHVKTHTHTLIYLSKLRCFSSSCSLNDTFLLTLFLSGTAKQAGPTTTTITTRETTKFMQLTKCLFFVCALQRFYRSKRSLGQQRTSWGWGQRNNFPLHAKVCHSFLLAVYIVVCVLCCPVASFLCHFLEALQSKVPGNESRKKHVWNSKW